jgi:hypothetical protein
MAIVVDLIKTYSPWVYGACALIALWYLRAALLARRERRNAVFALERETALNRTFGVWAVAFGLVLIMGLVYLLSTVVSDAVQPLVENPDQPGTPPMTVIAGEPTVTPTLPISELATPTNTPTPRPRPTLRPEPTAVLLQPTPTRILVRAPSCPDARAVITSPGVDAVVSGMVPIIGTAKHEGFQFYKLEYGVGANPNSWSYFDGGDQPVQGGRLGTLNAGALPPGTYSVRIVVVDATGNFPVPCQTTVEIR